MDFSNCPVNSYKYYGGNNGKKICIKYNDEDWMLKFAPVNPSAKENSSYTNSCISEHIACKVFASIEIDVQETILGEYNGNLVVACKDFETDGFRLHEFAELKNAYTAAYSNGYGTELHEVLDTIQEQSLIKATGLSDFFWDMFVTDAFVGNFDRHNGNWGFLISENEHSAKIAPIFDCGSCLYPQISSENILALLQDRDELLNRVYVFPNSALKIDNRKINYVDFLTGATYPQCNEAVKRIHSRIDMTKIRNIVDATPYIDEGRKKFYITMLELRKELIIDKSFNIINKKELTNAKAAISPSSSIINKKYLDHEEEIEK